MNLPQTEQLAVLRADDEPAGRQGGRGRQRAAGFELEHALARHHVEDVELAVVRADVGAVRRRWPARSRRARRSANVHSALPVFLSSACTILSRPPTMTRSPSDRGRRVERKAAVGMLVASRRSSSPSSRPRARRSHTCRSTRGRRPPPATRRCTRRTSIVEHLDAVADADAAQDLVAAGDVGDAVDDRPAWRARSLRSESSTPACRPWRRARRGSSRTSRSSTLSPATTGDDLISLLGLERPRRLAGRRCARRAGRRRGRRCRRARRRRLETTRRCRPATPCTSTSACRRRD